MPCLHLRAFADECFARNSIFAPLPRVLWISLKCQRADTRDSFAGGVFVLAHEIVSTPCHPIPDSQVHSAPVIVPIPSFFMTCQLLQCQNSFGSEVAFIPSEMCWKEDV